MGILRRIVLGRSAGHQGRRQRLDPLFYCKMCGMMLIPFKKNVRICTNCGYLQPIF